MPGFDDGKKTWYAEPHTKQKHPLLEGQYIVGTFRSTSCSGVGFIRNHICSACMAIPQLGSFRKRALLREKRIINGVRDTNKVNNQHLTFSEVQEKLKKQRDEIDAKESTIFFLKTRSTRLAVASRSKSEKLREYSRRGSMKAICHQLSTAAEAGQLDDRTVLRDFLETVSKNLHVEKHGKRYKCSIQMFFEVILLWGGPRLANFVSLNLYGPEIHSVYRWRTQHSVSLDPGLHENNFVKLTESYKATLEIKKLPRVPVLFAEDETAIIACIEYAQDRDILLGFCGEKADNHQCVDNCIVTVGDGQEGYDTIVNAFQQKRIGTQARAILINPLHPDYPKIPIVVHPTCNKFNADFVRHQWDRTAAMFSNHLEAIIGPLVGNSSDGDMRRRSIMLRNSTSQQGERYQPIPNADGFIFTCQKVNNPDDGTYTIRRAGDQDFIHNHKKLVNHLHHTARNLQMGPYMVHSNHLVLVINAFHFDDHKLSLEDVIRTDRQNWRSAQRITFTQVQDCLGMLRDGHANQRPDPSVMGTIIYLKVVWYYVEIFISKKATLQGRIQYAGLVTHFLAIWRNYVQRTEGLSLSANFLSRETYIDVLLSTHFAVSLICYMRDAFPDVNCHLELTGTDVVESYWSKNGQWVGNRHNYSYARLDRNLSHMIRLENIRVNPHAPEFAKPHPKGEVIWHQQYPAGWQPASQDVYPAHGDELVAWREGISMARELARQAGKPSLKL